MLRSSFGRHQDYTSQWVLGQSSILQAIVSLIRKAEERVWNLQVGLGHELRNREGGMPLGSQYVCFPASSGSYALSRR